MTSPTTNQPLFIRDWIELEEYAKTDPSPTHILEFKDRKVVLDNGKESPCNGYLRSKDGSASIPIGDTFVESLYLSTHTFYDNNHAFTTSVLQQCGFNVVLNNWDAKEGD